ncbi:MAG: ABC transporter transmembrane domain-containing protein [Collinsella sp.]
MVLRMARPWAEHARRVDGDLRGVRAIAESQMKEVSSMTEELKNRASVMTSWQQGRLRRRRSRPAWTMPPRLRSARLAASALRGNERAEDERARAEAERMRDVDDEDEDETPRHRATVRRCGARPPAIIGASISCLASIVFYVIFNTAAPAYSARVIDELWGISWRLPTTHLQHYLGELRQDHLHLLYDLDRRCSFYALQSFLMSSVAERLNLRLRNRIAQKLNRLPLAYFDAHRPGEVVSRATNDLDKMSESMQRGLLQLLVSIGTVVGAVSVMFVFSVQLTLVFLFFTALSLLVTKVVSRRTHDVTGERQEWVSKITSAVEEGYSGRLVIARLTANAKVLPRCTRPRASWHA